MRIPRTLGADHLEKLRVFRTKITDWASPSPTVYEEPVIVCVKVRREHKIAMGELMEPKMKVWYDELCVDHFHSKVVGFEDLLSQKEKLGYSIAVKDAVLAYMLVFEWGRKSYIRGFLSTFPEFKDVARLKEMVGENLSRLHAEGFIDAVSAPYRRQPPPPYDVPHPPEEALYVVDPSRRQIQLKRASWWEKGWV